MRISSRQTEIMQNNSSMMYCSTNVQKQSLERMCTFRVERVKYKVWKMQSVKYFGEIREIGKVICRCAQFCMYSEIASSKLRDFSGNNIFHVDVISLERMDRLTGYFTHVRSKCALIDVTKINSIFVKVCFHRWKRIVNFSTKIQFSLRFFFFFR